MRSVANAPLANPNLIDPSTFYIAPIPQGSTKLRTKHGFGKDLESAVAQVVQKNIMQDFGQHSGCYDVNFYHVF